MRRILVLVVALVSLGLLAGCSGSSASDASVQRVDAATFSEVVATDGTQVIDVRTPAEFAAGHLEGAVNIDVEDPSFAAKVATLDDAATYAVYCRSGNRSQSAVAQMADAGIGSIYELGGGINEWAGAGLPIVQ